MTRIIIVVIDRLILIDVISQSIPRFLLLRVTQKVATERQLTTKTKLTNPISNQSQTNLKPISNQPNQPQPNLTPTSNQSQANLNPISHQYHTNLKTNLKPSQTNKPISNQSQSRTNLRPISHKAQTKLKPISTQSHTSLKPINQSQTKPYSLVQPSLLVTRIRLVGNHSWHCWCQNARREGLRCRCGRNIA